MVGIDTSFVSENVQQTYRIAEGFANAIKEGEVVFVKGEMGAGKTEFIRGMLLFWHIDMVKSPSFVTVIRHMNKYGRVFYHIDLYRINSFLEILERGIFDIMEKRDGIVLLEWPERIEAQIKPDYLVLISFLGKTKRRIKIQKIEI